MDLELFCLHNVFLVFFPWKLLKSGHLTFHDTILWNWLKVIAHFHAIQRRAARFVRGDYSRTSSVSSITRELGWASLESRRTVHDLTLFYKIHSGAVIIQFPPELVSTVRRTRASQQHNRTFIHPCTSVDSYKYSFFVRTVPYWNSLPPSVINANSTTSFFSQVSNIYCH